MSLFLPPLFVSLLCYDLIFMTISNFNKASNLVQRTEFIFISRISIHGTDDIKYRVCLIDAIFASLTDAKSL